MNTAQRNRSLIDKLTKSKLYRQFDEAFSEVTELPLTLRPLQYWELAQANHSRQNGFCRMVSQHSRSCGCCLSLQKEICETVLDEAHTLTCPFGLSETAVPVKVGAQVVGYLQTGQVMLRRPTNQQFLKAMKHLEEWGVEVDEQEAHARFFDTAVLTPTQYEFRIRLLSQFAEHLSVFANQIAVQQEHGEHPTIVRAKHYIGEHHADEISLTEVARNVHVSVYYLCRLFKEVTGLNFTDYVSRVRIEKAKDLLLNLNYRVSEIAYEVGFQSLTHFNRVFKRVVGQSPTIYRSHLPKA